MPEKKKRKHCFVIMPFSKTSEKHTKQYWTNHFNTFLKPLIEESEDLEAYRSKPLRGDILRQIITQLVVSPVVIADFTDHSPNVFWELGVRQSFKHGTVTIAEEGTDIPFDISVKGTLFYYPKNHIKNAEFVNEFKEAITDCLSHPDIPDSHVLETISGRGTLFEIFRRHESARRIDGLLTEYEENVRVRDSIFNQIKKGSKLLSMFVRFRTASIELLLTDRYLEEDNSLYEHADNMHSWLATMNGELAMWKHFRKDIEEALLINKKMIFAVFEEYRQSLDTAQKKLLASSPFL